METKKIVESLMCCHNLDDCKACEYNELGGFCEELLKRDAAKRLEKLESEIAELKKQLAEQQSEWISVEEWLPKENGTYLIAVKGSCVSHFSGFDIESNEFCDNVFRKADITHWMSSPKPPKPKKPTFKDVFLERFPGAVVLPKSGAPVVCAKQVFPQLGDDESTCDMCCAECWNQPYFAEGEGEEGEADA